MGDNFDDTDDTDDDSDGSDSESESDPDEIARKSIVDRFKAANRTFAGVFPLGMFSMISAHYGQFICGPVKDFIRDLDCLPSIKRYLTYGDEHRRKSLRHKAELMLRELATMYSREHWRSLQTEDISRNARYGYG